MLSDKDIRRGWQEGFIHIQPYDPSNLGPNSYDCRLGGYFFRPHSGHYRPIDPLDEENVRHYWRGPSHSTEIIWLNPSETILGHTEEIIGTTRLYVAHMHGRSTLARLGVSVHQAGFGDVGFVSKWTLEITNHNAVPIELRVGMRICQFSFEYVGETERDYVSTGKYTTGGVWSPDDMIPKLWMDREFTNKKEEK